MRSAIFYPEVEITRTETMQTALLLWDRLEVIVPFADLPIRYHDPDMAAAWELIGGKMLPDDDQQRRAHQEIVALTEQRLPPNLYYRDDAPLDASYELWPQKLSRETWELLVEQGLTREPLANGDYALNEQVALAIMAKLADACAGDTFARVTDRFLAFGLVGDRGPDTLAETVVAPITLSIIDATKIPLKDLVAFRRREVIERLGGDYRELRHRYADRIAAHIDSIKEIRSVNEARQRNAEFEADMARDMEVLRREIGGNRVQTILTPVVAATAVAAGTWPASHDLVSSLSGSAVAAALGSPKGAEIAGKIAELFQLPGKFSRRQRDIMAAHPMAYLYTLSRAI